MDDIQVELKVPVNVNSSFTPTSPLQGFLNASPGDADKLSLISEFVRGDKQEFSDIDLLQAVRSIETKLGLPQIGQKRVDMLYNYVKLQSQIDTLSKERDHLLR